MKKQIKKILQILTATVLLFPTGARADDVALFTLGGLSAAANWPATVVFALDTSGSMLFHNCESCFQSGWQTKTVENGAKICTNTNFNQLVGPDLDGDNVRDSYLAPYESDGVTWRGTQYVPILDKGTNDSITYKSCSFWYPDYHSNYKDVGPDTSNMSSLNCGVRGSEGEKEAFDAAVKTYCSRYSSCDEANRCIYSLRTQGYFSTKCTGSTGNPYKNACSCNPALSDNTDDDNFVPQTLSFWEYEQTSFTNTDSNFSMKVLAKNQTMGTNATVPYGKDYVTGSIKSGTQYITRYTFPGASGSYTPKVNVNVINKYNNGGTVKVKSSAGTVSANFSTSNTGIQEITLGSLTINHGDTVETTIDYKDKSNYSNVRYNYMLLTSSSVKVPRAPAYKKIHSENMSHHANLEMDPNHGYVVGASNARAVVEIKVPQSGKYKLIVNGYNSEYSNKNINITVGSVNGTATWARRTNGDVTMKQSNNSTAISLNAGYTTVTLKNIENIDYVDWVALVPDSWNGSTGDGGNYSNVVCDVDAGGLVVYGDSVNTGASKRNIIYLGDWMNFNPRRDHQVASALYDLMDELEDDVRIGYATYRDIPSVKGSTTANANLHTDILADDHTKNVLPPCTSVVNNSNCTDNNNQTACFTQTYRDYFKNEIFNFVGEYNTGTPTAETMDHIGYFARKTSGGSQAFFCDTCQSNAFMIVLTDGEPSGSYDTPSSGKCPTGLSTTYAINGNKQYKDGIAYSNSYCMDEVAYLLHANDIMDTTDGVQNSLTTYTISFALTDLNNPDQCPQILNQTAAAGGGTCIPAYDITSLKEALHTIIKDITPRAMTYTAPSVAGVRGSGEDSVVSTTFVPSAEMPFWEAHVYKFILCDETDENQNCSCSNPDDDQEMCIVGRNGSLVAYEDSVLKTEPVWDAQLCLSGDYLNKHGVGVLDADPWSKSVTGCYRYADESAENRRKIFTTVPQNTDGIYNKDDYQIEFVSNNPTNLSYLKTAFGYDNNEDTTRLIKFLRGFDVDDFDHDGDVTEERSLSTLLDGTGNVVKGWWKLGDIFHSSPVLVSGLSDTFNYGSYRNRANPNSGFAGEIKNRRAIYLTGANDGMVHAFDAGQYNNDGILEGDTGAELWAFIPPSHLAKLPNMCRINGTGCAYDNKLYFVDASPTYRDIYTGDLNDDLGSNSNKDKWKTIVIGGMRDGGNTYYALDVTDTGNPQFLWEFPPYGTAARAAAGITENFGLTWMDMGASPSSIGAIALDNNKPKWVALLGAGYDRKDTKGRGYYIVEPYTGNVLYSAQYSSNNAMKYSFAAAPAFTDPKTIDATNGVLAFSKIIALDHGGQVWVQDLFTETTKPTINNGKLENISAPTIRFKTNKTNLAPGQYQTSPIFFLPVTVKGTNGKLRAVFGTGDRDVLIPAAESFAWDQAVCNTKGAIYSVVVEAGTCGNTPCNPENLAYRSSGPVNAGDGVNNVALAKSTGWYVELNPGERVVNPPSVMSYRKANGQNSGAVVVTTFEPTLACDRGDTSVLKSCGNNNGSNGIGRLYMLDVETGEAIFDTTVLDGEVPADPRITTKVGEKVESAILLPGNKENPTPTVKRTVSYDDVIERMFDIEIGRDVHNALHHN